MPADRTEQPTPTPPPVKTADGWSKDAAVVTRHSFHVEPDIANEVAKRTLELLARLGQKGTEEEGE